MEGFLCSVCILIRIFDVIGVAVSHQHFTGFGDVQFSLNLIVIVIFTDVEVIQVVTGYNAGGFVKPVCGHFKIHCSIVFLEHIILGCNVRILSNTAKTLCVGSVSVVPVSVMVPIRAGKLFDAILSALQRSNCIDSAILIGREHTLRDDRECPVLTQDILAYIAVIGIIPDTIAGTRLLNILTGLGISLNQDQRRNDRGISDRHLFASVYGCRGVRDREENRVCSKHILRCSRLNHHISTPGKIRYAEISVMVTEDFCKFIFIFYAGCNPSFR